MVVIQLENFSSLKDQGLEAFEELATYCCQVWSWFIYLPYIIFSLSKNPLTQTCILIRFVFLNILSWKPQFVRRRSWPGQKFLHWRFLSFILLPSNHNPSHDWNDQQVIMFDKGFVTSLINNDFQETNCHQRGKLTRLRKKYCALLELWVILPINLKSFNVLW